MNLILNVPTDHTFRTIFIDAVFCLCEILRTFCSIVLGLHKHVLLTPTETWLTIEIIVTVIRITIIIVMMMNDTETSSAGLRAETPFAPVTHFTVH